jgi:LTXXQ motif family protein
MAMMKAGLAGVAIGALTLATAMFVAPIAAQGPGAPPLYDRGPGAQRGQDAPGLRGPGMGPGIGQDRGQPGRRGADANDPDITGPRGEAGICQERLTRMAQFRLQRIERLVRPSDAQRPAFEDLKSASAKALDIARAACPMETPLTPTGRLELAEKRTEARLAAIKLMRPPLEAFYKLLSDEQKVRWSLGIRGDRGGVRDRGPEAFDRRDDRRRGDMDEAARERGRDDGRFGDRRGMDPRRGDQDRWGDRWRDMERADPRWRNEYQGSVPDRL